MLHNLPRDKVYDIYYMTEPEFYYSPSPVQSRNHYVTQLLSEAELEEFICAYGYYVIAFADVSCLPDGIEWG